MAPAKSKKLGRGLASLLSQPPTTTEGEEIVNLDVESVVPNQYQPREVFDPAALEELVESIQQNGILQPIIVRPTAEGTYELVAGERRWRAAQHLGLPSVPAIVRTIEDDQMLQLALVENLQREDLNPMEKARAFRLLIDQFGLTQTETAQRVGQDRSSVANFLRLLDLPETVQSALAEDRISMGHARALLALRGKSRQVDLCKRIEKESLSVRQVEQIVYEGKKKSKAKQKTRRKPAHVLDMERRLREAVGTKVVVNENNGRGTIVIEFYSLDDFDRIMELLGSAGKKTR